MRPAVLLALIATLAGFGWPADASGQITGLSVTGFPVTFPPVTGSHFAAGFIDGTGATTFSVDARAGGPRTASVSIRCGAPCPTTGPKPLTTLQWRRADLGIWNTLTTSDEVVEQRSMVGNGMNDPWSNQILWRFTLDWINDLPGSTTTFNVVFTLTITVP